MSLDEYDLLGLAHEIHEDIPRWPDDPRIHFKTVAMIDRDGFFLRAVTVGEHSATHQNAPASFIPTGESIAAIGPKLMSLIVIDIRDKTQVCSDDQLSIEDLIRFEAKHGPIPPGAFVALYTGWEHLWHQPASFLGLDEAGRLHFPSYSESALDWLLERKIVGIGTDTHGVDAPADAHYRVQRRCLAHGGVVVECLNHLSQLPPRGAWLLLAPLPLAGGSGSPVNPVALIARKEKMKRVKKSTD